MKRHGLYLPAIFNYQHYDNTYKIPFKKIKNQQFFVPIDVFRELYKEDKQIFNQVTTEFILRGGQFNLLKSSPLFPQIEITNRKVIFSSVKTPVNAYKEIDYDLLNIGEFKRFFNIRNNSFFNNIPLEGFKVLNLSSNDIKILENNLTKAGFNIYESNDELLYLKPESVVYSSQRKKEVSEQTEHKRNIKQPLKSILSKNNSKPKGKDTAKENVIQKIINLIQTNLFYDYIEIKNLSNSYIKHVFKKHGVNNIKDLKKESIQPIFNDLSLHHITNLYNELSDITLDHKLMATILLNFVKDNPKIKSILLTQLLNENSDRNLIRNAMEIGINKLGDITLDKAVAWFDSRGIGKKKISSLLNVVFDYKNHFKKTPTKTTTVLNPKVKKDFEVKNNDEKVIMLKKIHSEVAESTLYQNLHVSELDVSLSLMQLMLDEDIVYLSDLLQQDKLNLLHEKLTEKQLKLIFRTINNITKNHDLLSNVLIRFIHENTHIANYYLKGILDNSTFRIVIQNANKCGVKKLGDFTLENSIKFFKSKGVGKKKIVSFFEVLFDLPETKASKLLESSETDDGKSKYLAYFMLEEQVPKKYLIENQIALVNKLDLEHLVIRLVKNQAHRDKILQNIEAKVEDIKQFKLKKVNEIESYQLSIEEVLSYLNLNYILEDLPQSSEVLSLPVNSLLENEVELSFEIVQVILYYIDKIQNFKEFGENFIESLFNLKERELTIFRDRINTSNPKTLEELATEFGLSRERVRQIEKKIKTKIKSVLTKNGLGLYREHLKKRGVVFLKESSLRNTLISINYPGFYYDSDLDLLLISDYEEKYLEIQKEIEKLFKKNDFIKIKDIELFINDLNKEYSEYGLNEHIEKIFQYYIEKSNYIQKNEVLLKENISKNKVYTYIIEEYYSKEVLDLSNEQSYNLFLDRLKLTAPEKIVNDLLKRPKDSAIRSIEGILDRENDKVLKLDAHKYRKLDVNRIPYSLIDDIYNFINDEILNNKFVSIKKIYRSFKSEIHRLGYSDKSIYYLLKFLFEEEFQFKGKTSLRIFEKDAEILSTVEIILTTLDKNNGRMSINDLTEEIGMEDYSIHQHSGQTTYMVRNGLVSVVNDESKLSENTLSVIRNTFNSMLKDKGYVPIQQIYDELKFNLKVNQDLRENNYTTLSDFTHLLKKMFPDTEGHTRILFHKNSNQDYFDVFIRELGEMDEYHREDLVKAGEKLGLSEQTIYMYLNDFIDKGKLAPINSDFFVLASSLNFGDDELENIDLFLKEKFNGTEYLSLTTINSEFRHLSKINNIRWTIELMNYIATKELSYKKVNIKNIKYTADPMIIVREDSDLTYKDIVTLEMKQFKDNRTDENVLNYLKQKGLLKSNAKHIYKWFFSKGIFIRNDFRRIYLAEED